MTDTTTTGVTVYAGNCLDYLKRMPENSVDLIATDPPYGLGEVKDLGGLLTAWVQGEEGAEHIGGAGFHRMVWDAGVPPPIYWKECLRVLKPGGYLAAFAGTRTQDLMGMSIRLGGFDMRDEVSLFSHRTLTWLDANRLPMTEDMEHPVLGHLLRQRLNTGHDPILLFRKPMTEKTTLANVKKWGTGAVHAGRIMVDSPRSPTKRMPKNVIFQHHELCQRVGEKSIRGVSPKKHEKREAAGVFEIIRRKKTDYAGIGENGVEWVTQWACVSGYCLPTMWSCYTCGYENTFVLTDRNRLINDPWGMCSCYGCEAKQHVEASWTECCAGLLEDERENVTRYFEQLETTILDDALMTYQSKASNSERHTGCETLPGWSDATKGKNPHKAIKSVAIMRWLIRAFAVEGDVILDPFAGSGTTGMAALMEGCEAILCEKDPYMATRVIPSRVNYWAGAGRCVVLNPLQDTADHTENLSDMEYAPAEIPGEIHTSETVLQD